MRRTARDMYTLYAERLRTGLDLPDLPPFFVMDAEEPELERDFFTLVLEPGPTGSFLGTDVFLQEARDKSGVSDRVMEGLYAVGCCGDAAGGQCGLRTCVWVYPCRAGYGCET